MREEESKRVGEGERKREIVNGKRKRKQSKMIKDQRPKASEKESERERGYIDDR